MKSHNALWRGTVAALMSVALAACGGGASLGTGTTTSTGTTTTGTGTTTTGTGTTSTGTTTTATPSKVTLVPSSNTLPSNADTASKGVTIRAIVTDANNNAVPGATVTFTSSSGTLISGGTTTNATSASGESVVTLTTGGDSSLRNITINANATGNSVTVMATPITVSVVNPSSTTTSTSTPSKVVLVAASSTLASNASSASSGDTITAIVTDANNVAVGNATVTFSASSGALVNLTATTDSSGQGSVTLTTGGDSSLRNITINANATGNSTTIGASPITVSVVAPGSNTTTTTPSNVTLVSGSSTLPSDANTASQGVTIRAILTDSNNAAVSGAAVTFSASSGALTNISATTNSSGEATATLTTGGNTTQRAITVKASTGNIAASPITVNVVAPASTPVVAPGLGYLNGSTYSDGVIGTDLTTLAAGGSAGLTVDIVDRNNANQRLTTSTNVSFTSNCQAQGLADIVVSGNTAGTNGDNAGATSTGHLTATYIAKGCTGADPIRATATPGSTTLTATTSLTVQAAAVGAINFVSASPTNIGIQGSGEPATSTVIFVLKDQSGGTVVNKCVFFNLNTSVGGITLSPPSAVTNSNGQVQTVVTSGDVAAAVRVTATAYTAADTRDSSGNCVQPSSGTSVVSQSNQLTISTLIPHQNGFSVSASPLNIEAFNRDGIPSKISIIAADRFGNPVPDGTAVSLITECGKIQAYCTSDGSAAGTAGTTAGTCQANYVSGGRRETTTTTDANGNVATGGRCTVLATAVGEESFGDVDGNGRYSKAAGDVFSSPGDDLPEAFLDRNEDGQRTVGSNSFTTDDFIDFNHNGVYDTFDGLFNGLLCDSGCGALNSIDVRGSLVIVQSTGNASISFASSTTTPTAGQTFLVVARVSDLNNNKMAAGTNISASAVNASIANPTAYTQPDSTSIGPASYAFYVTANAGLTKGQTGSVTVQVTSPSGIITVGNFNFTVSG